MPESKVGLNTWAEPADHRLVLRVVNTGHKNWGDNQVACMNYSRVVNYLVMDQCDCLGQTHPHAGACHGQHCCQRDLRDDISHSTCHEGKRRHQCERDTPFPPSRFLYGPLLIPFCLSFLWESTHSSDMPYFTQRRQGRASSHFLQAF